MMIFTRSLMDTLEVTGEKLEGVKFFHRSEGENFHLSFEIKVEFKMYNVFKEYFIFKTLTQRQCHGAIIHMPHTCLFGYD